MRPIRLEIENLRSFRKKQIIPFDGLQLFAIMGDTGVGKTSILEAITYALFNRSTWSGTNVRELIAKGESTMAVTFLFSVDGDKYTITRISKERGVAQHRLSCPARNIDVASEAEVRDEVRKALHFDAPAFLHTVLLPQGKHAELLTARDAERHRILSELFRLDEIPEVLEKAKIHQGQAAAHLKALEVERATLPAEPDDALAAAQEVVAAANGRVDVTKDGVERAAVLDATISDKRKAIEMAEWRKDQLRDVDEIPARLRAIEDSDIELLRASQTFKEQKDAAKTASTKAATEVQALEARAVDRESILDYETILNRIELTTREIVREESERTKAQQLLKAATAKNAELSNQQEAIAAQHDRAKEELAKNEDQTAESRRVVGQVELLNNIYQDARKNEDDHAKELRDKDGLLKSAGDRIKATDKDLLAAKQHQQHTSSVLEHARVTLGAAAIAVHLHPGDNCPVCDRKLPVSFTAPHAEDLEQAKRDDATAQMTLRKAESESTKARSENEGQQRAQVECVKRLELAQKDTARAYKALAGVLADPADDPAAVIANLTNKVEELNKSGPEAKARYERAAQKMQSFLTEVASVTQQIRGYRERIEVLSASLTERKKSRLTDIELLSPAFSPGPEGVELDSARRAVKKALDEAGRVQKALKDANDAIATATSNLAEIEKKRSSAVVAPRSTLYGRLNHIGSLLNVAAMPDDDAAQKTWATDIVTKAKEEIQLLQKRLADSKAELDKHCAARRRLAEDLGDEPQAAFTAASIQLSDAKNRLEDAQHAVARVAKISTKIGKLEPARLGLEILRDELGARRFAKYATEKRQERLLEEGTAIFMDMTGGRYAFTRDFQIWDHVTNEGRPPQTLSGGEKFLASLALSLAVVEIAANAGAKIESLFLDEGFASLDVETLEMAMMELRKRSKAGRSICVISHLSQVTKFVTDTFLIKAREEGSEVQHIEGPIDDDADMIEGLVTQLVTA